MGVQVTGGGVIKRTKRAFLVSGTANEGYGVCYNNDALNVTAENETLANASAVDWCDARRAMVEVPSGSNAIHFAGVVDGASNGVVGPNWILIHEPGSICKILCADTATYNNGEVFNFTIAVNSTGAADTENGQFSIGGMAGSGAAQVLQTRATASALGMAELLTGPPSGGITQLGIISTNIVAGTTVPIHGTVILSAGFGRGQITTATATGTISVPTGKWVGQRLVIIGALLAVSAIVSVNFGAGGVLRGVTSVEVGTSPLISGDSATITVSTQTSDTFWNGVKWVQQGNAVTT